MALRTTVFLAVLSAAASSEVPAMRGPTWTNHGADAAPGCPRMNAFFKERGDETISFKNPALDPINASNYYFPKKGPPRKKVIAPKWEQDRYRNYKHRPGTPMRHVLKPPTAPRGLTIAWAVPDGKDFAESATVLWLPPASTGQTNITHYLMSRDDGLTWEKVEGGGDIKQTEVKGVGQLDEDDESTTKEATTLERGQEISILLRAVNAVGPGPWASASAVNRARLTYSQRKAADSLTLEADWPVPAYVPRVIETQSASEAKVRALPRLKKKNTKSKPIREIAENNVEEAGVTAA